MIYTSVYKSPIGMIYIVANDTFLLSVSLNEKNVKIVDNSITLKCKQELKEYFSGNRASFDLPLCFSKTNFSNQVLHELQKVSYGETISYQELAKRTGNVKASRAVGGVIHRNPYLIIIPCHRVIGKNGHLTGFACGLSVKEYLLCFEKKNCLKK